MIIKKGQFVRVCLDDTYDGDFCKIVRCVELTDIQTDEVNTIRFDLYDDGYSTLVNQERCREVLSKEEFPELYL